MYKVETIRECYMVASGLPEATDNHAEQIAHMSCHILLAVQTYQSTSVIDDDIRLKIGIHTGTCSAQAGK